MLLHSDWPGLLQDTRRRCHHRGGPELAPDSQGEDGALSFGVLAWPPDGAGEAALTTTHTQPGAARQKDGRQHVVPWATHWTPYHTCLASQATAHALAPAFV